MQFDVVLFVCYGGWDVWCMFQDQCQWFWLECFDELQCDVGYIVGLVGNVGFIYYVYDDGVIGWLVFGCVDFGDCLWIFGIGIEFVYGFGWEGDQFVGFQFVCGFIKVFSGRYGVGCFGLMWYG